MDPGVGLAILVEDGVQHPPRTQHGHRLLDPATIPRETWNLLQQREGAIVVSSSGLGFFRRMITKVTELITWIRRVFVFRVAKNGNLQVNNGRRATEKEIKVEEAASGACEPQLAEIIVSGKETIINAESNTVKLLDNEDCDSNCLKQITVEHDQFDTCENPTFLAENDVADIQAECASPSRDSLLQKPDGSGVTFSPELINDVAAVQTECTSPSRDPLLQKPDGSGVTFSPELINDVAAVQTECTSPSRDPLPQKPADSGVIFSPELIDDVAAIQSECASPSRDSVIQKPDASGVTFSPELDNGPGTEQHDKSLSEGQDASREEEFRDDGTPEKHLTTDASSGDGDTKLETSVEESDIEQVTSSKSVNKKFSIHQLNAIVTKNLIKYLQALERSMVPGTWDQNTTHHRAIILATLVAVVVWARNSRHLHESMPRISGSAINVHIRSRL